MAGKIVKRGSIVLIRYPFTDLTSSKVRPAVMLTPDIILKKQMMCFVFLSHLQFLLIYFKLIS